MVADHSADGNRMTAAKWFLRTRKLTEELAAPLTAEDQTIQSMPDGSPTKWHLGHTTWFFEEFVLKKFIDDYRCLDPHFGYIFNSYYEALGPRQPRALRGVLSRPSLTEVAAYRRHVDELVERLIMTISQKTWDEMRSVIDLGLHHEQQHQELLLTDILHLFSLNPMRPCYSTSRRETNNGSDKPNFSRMVAVDGGTYTIGYAGSGFCFDNERPCHRVMLNEFRLASGLVTNGEWKEFIDDDGYRRPQLWLSDGWATVQSQGWEAPLYWERGADGVYRSMTLHGLQPVDDDAPVCHVSYYEADAFARWAGKRLPTEAEWEVGATHQSVEGNFLESGYLRPLPASRRSENGGPFQQLFGDVWEWTQSPYVAYPGYQPWVGAIGEYNGKFMCNQLVLRGGSCVSPVGHLRASYRNFFYPHQRWQFTGVRLAEDRPCKR
jgi:ergothioneine biosynthesis protein EgtB